MKSKIFLIIGTLFLLQSCEDKKSNLATENKELPKVISNSNEEAKGEKVYNVKDFGAIGNGVDDDTFAIQSALDYIVDNGGGTLYLPKGVYILNTIQEKYGQKGHLIIKPRGNWLKDHSWTQIRILGEVSVTTASTYAAHSGGDASVDVWQNGTVLKSTYSGNLQTNSSAPCVAVLSAGYTTQFHGKFNSNQIVLENFAVQVKAQKNGFPRLSGINMGTAESLRARNVFVYGSIPNVLQKSPSKAKHYSAGFIAPRLYCAPEQQFEGVYVKGGFRYGFIFSEHAQGQNLSAWDCDNAFVFSRMDHSSTFGHIHAQNCKNIVVSLDSEFADHHVGNSYINIQNIGIESNSGQAPTDFNYENFVYDPNNHLKGKFTYHIVRSNIGADNSYYKQVGGEGLTTDTLF